jgi:hypothetical protein
MIMPMEALAVDKLIEKAHFRSDVALAVAEAMDITLQAHNFVTVPMLDVRFTAVEKSIASVEKSIESAKVWAITLYAGLGVVLFGTLAANHDWLVSREDQMQVRTDQRFQQIDVRFQQMETHLQQVDLHLQQVDTELKEIHALLTAPHRRRSSRDH